MPQCRTPLKHWGVPPSPPMPLGREFLLRADDGMCLTAVAASERATVTMAQCVTTALRDRDKGASLGGGVQNWTVNAAKNLLLANSAFYVKPNYVGRDDCAAAGASIWLGETEKNTFHVVHNGSTIQLEQKCKIAMCLVRNGNGNIDGGVGLHLGRCTDPGAQGWTQVLL